MERQLLNETRTSRQPIATYRTYAEAQRAVDFLSDQKFPVERIAIVAEGLNFVEQVTGRLNYGRAILSGALSGAFTGVFVGLIFSLLSPAVALLSFVLYGLVVGAIVGAIIGLVSYALSGGRRDFSSVGGIQADRYIVQADSEVAGEAQRLLNTMPPA
jgi:hypothetical protein